MLELTPLLTMWVFQKLAKGPLLLLLMWDFLELTEGSTLLLLMRDLLKLTEGSLLLLLMRDFLGLTGGSVLLLPMRDLLELTKGWLYCFLMRDLWSLEIRLTKGSVNSSASHVRPLEAGHFFWFSCETFLELINGSALLLPMRDLLGLTIVNSTASHARSSIR